MSETMAKKLTLSSLNFEEVAEIISINLPWLE